MWTPPQPSIPESLLLAPPANHLEREALTAFANLSNHILATKASKTLARLKARHRELFSNPGLYYRTLEMLANHHYRLTVRRYVIELFDLEVDEAGVMSVMEAGDVLRMVEDEDEFDEEAWLEKRRDLNQSQQLGLRPRPDGSKSKLGLNGFGVADDVATDEDDEDDIGGSSSSEDEGAKPIPLQVLHPLVTVKGFMLS